MCQMMVNIMENIRQRRAAENQGCGRSFESSGQGSDRAIFKRWGGF